MFLWIDIETLPSETKPDLESISASFVRRPAKMQRFTRPIEDALRAENAKLHEQIADLYATIIRAFKNDLGGY